MSQEHLKFLASIPELPKKHIEYLKHLKNTGFEPKVIYDIGSCVLHWTSQAKLIWPDAKYILFDAFEPAEFLYTGYDYYVGLLSNSDNTEVKFYQNNQYPGGNSYYREIGHYQIFFPKDNFIIKKTHMLDSVVKELGFPLPDLVKIDVQGSELDVIEGGAACLSNAKELIVELQHTHYNEGAKLAVDSIPIIENYGWKCVSPLFSNNGNDGDYGFSKRNHFFPSHSLIEKHNSGFKLSWLKRI